MFGLVVAAVAGIAVWLQVAIVLWGPQDLRFPLMTLEWPEEEGTKIEGKERIKLEELEEATWDLETETLAARRPNRRRWARVTSAHDRLDTTDRGDWEMKSIRTMVLATAGVAVVAALGDGDHGRGAGARALEDAERVPEQPLAPRHLGRAAEEIVERVSGGNFELKFFEPGALVPALECFDAASKGSVESCLTTAGYHTGKYPALAFFTAVPFGPGFGEYFAWMIYGGGKELQNEIYARNGLYSLDCNTIGPETSGWFREQVELARRASRASRCASSASARR